MAEKKLRPLTYVLQPAPDGGVACYVCASYPKAETGHAKSMALNLKKFLRSPEVMSILPQHRRLAMRLSMSQPLGYASDVVLRGRDGVAVVRELIQTGKCHWTRDGRAPLKWGEPLAGEADWEMPGRKLHQPLLRIPQPVTAVLPLTPPLYVDTRGSLCGEINTGLPAEAAAAWAGGQTLDAEAAAQFAYDLLQRFSGIDIPLPPTATVQPVAGIPGIPCLTIQQKEFRPQSTAVSSEGKTQAPVLRIEFDYGGRRIRHSSTENVISVQESGALKQIQRDQAQERDAVTRLKAYGFMPLTEMLPCYQLQTSEGDWGLPGKGTHDWRSFVQSEIPKLQKEGWQVDFAKGFRLIPVAEDAWYSELESSGTDWFEFEAGFCVDGRKVNLLPVIHRFLQENRGRSLQKMTEGLQGRSVAVPLEDGAMAIVAGERFALILRSLFELYDRDPLQKNSRLRMNFWRIAEIAELEKLSASPWAAPEKVRKLAEKLQSGFCLEGTKAPRGFRGRLRPYQELGLSWLQFLREHELDGILADDMGLGKTVQALAHLLQEKRAGRLDDPCLIVAPTSLMKNWVDEAARFTPGLSVLLLHGPDRKVRFDDIGKADIVLTTYALLRWDAELYRDKEFAYAILDEAQFIKNHKAQVAQMARSLRCRRRLCLTGTPMENHLGELWSLFHFLMPGFLGSQQAFKVQFRNPVEKDSHDDLRQVLSKRVAPFLLRRTKEEVAPELPPKSEIIQSVELTDKQRDLYETVRIAMETRIRQEIKKKGLSRSHIIILDALLKLRQICCDPRLMHKGAEESGVENSCKLTALLEMLPELVEDGRHILLFSQFTQMLKLIESEVRKLKIGYVKLTGSTRDRATPIARFQAGTAPLFLISLKAGGTGLNLTAADAVIHFDPWWNPSVENQATDRAHRIGQDKPVFVYKLLTAGTVESKILELQKRKKELVAGILSEQSSGRIRFEKEDLENLFSPIG